MGSLALAVPILIPLGTAMLAPFLDLFSKKFREIFCMAAAAATLVSLARLVPEVAEGRTLVYWMSGWAPRSGLAIGISLAVDAWSLLIALIVAGVGFLSLIYSAYYLQRETGRGAYDVLFMLLIAALIGFALSGDLFNQFVWLEVFSVAAFALTGFHYNDRTAIEAAFKYLITNSIAALMIAIALSLLYMQTGALNLAHIAGEYHGTPAGIVALGLLVGGYATKAALVPWHFWLPDAHTIAPAPVSALFSGALIKIGIYAIARSLFTLAPELLQNTLQMPLLAVAALSMVIGGVQMLRQESIKRILAFSSVSQMGYALMGLAIGTPLALTAAALHLIHHSLVKSALFMGAGAVSHQAHVRTLREGGGLAGRMPMTLAVFLLAGLSLSGMPFFSGFVSKTMLEEAAAAMNLGWLAAVAIFASVLTLAGIGRLIWHVFFAPPTLAVATGLVRTPGGRVESKREEILPGEWTRSARKFSGRGMGNAKGARPGVGLLLQRSSLRAEVHEAPFLALAPMLALVIGSLFVGMLPRLPVAALALPAARALAEPERYVASVLETGLLPNGRGDEAELEETPNPLDLHHWIAPAITLISGIFIVYAMLNRRSPPYARLSRLVLPLVEPIRRWHSGVVNDYALWTALGTALMLVIFFVLNRFQAS